MIEIATNGVFEANRKKKHGRDAKNGWYRYDTRFGFHIVKQDEYPIYDGEHDAIISEEDFMLAKEKRSRTGVRHEKTHSLEHEHILSGILRCPVCGGSMYANVNRKKKNDGSYYKDFFYYACKHRLRIDGHHCDYHRQWAQDKVNAAVEETIKEMVNNSKFRAALKDKIGANVDTSELLSERDSYRKRLQQCIGAKNKFAAQIDALDISDKHYDRKYQDMQDRLDSFYDQISDSEEKIETVNKRIDNLLQESFQLTRFTKCSYSLTSSMIVLAI